MVAVGATMSPWTPLIAAASVGAFGLYLWFLSQFEGWQTRIVVVFATILTAALGWIWITMGVGMVVPHNAEEGGDTLPATAKMTKQLRKRLVILPVL